MNIFFKKIQRREDRNTSSNALKIANVEVGESFNKIMITHMVTQTEILGNALKNIQAKIDKLKEIIFTFWLCRTSIRTNCGFEKLDSYGYARKVVLIVSLQR